MPASDKATTPSGGRYPPSHAAILGHRVQRSPVESPRQGVVPGRENKETYRSPFLHRLAARPVAGRVAVPARLQLHVLVCKEHRNATAAASCLYKGNMCSTVLGMPLLALNRSIPNGVQRHGVTKAFTNRLRVIYIHIRARSLADDVS